MSGEYHSASKGQKRGINEANPPSLNESLESVNTSPAGTYKSMRMSLKPLPQPPNVLLLPIEKCSSHRDTNNSSDSTKSSRHYERAQSYSPTGKVSDIRSGPAVLSRSDSIRPASSKGRRQLPPRPSYLSSQAHAYVTAPDLATLQRSSTGHLRTLSQLTTNGSGADFSISSPAEEVAGLHGRRRLQRTGSVRCARGPGKSGKPVVPEWVDRNWMDKQRQFLQAYEYLCHIGEAKEWIEDIIHKPIPPIVQLEEALRDGVTLAEIVQTLHPERTLKIFRHAKLQFRHSDNIALFFRFLAEVDLPELFRFELIDLYEKKNIPKVIYCIHALSWLLYRKGIVHFRIGNLVGQLEFEHHELEEVQRGLDKAGITMPSFTGVGASFGGYPEPEPEPELEPLETEEERIQRELAQVEATVVEFQGQARAAVLRIRLGKLMQGLWDAEETLVALQSTIRGDWARQIAGYRLEMRIFAVHLQSAARGYLVRSQLTARRNTESLAVNMQRAIRGFLVRSRAQTDRRQLKEKEKQIVNLQSLARASRTRRKQQNTSQQIEVQAEGIRKLQAAIRGNLCRYQVASQAQQAQATSNTIKDLQAVARGFLLRQEVRQDKLRLEEEAGAIKNVQSDVRGTLVRRLYQDNRQILENHQEQWDFLQANERGNRARKAYQFILRQLKNSELETCRLQAVIRGSRARRRVRFTMDDLASAAEVTVKLQAVARGHLLRELITSRAAALQLEATGITVAQSYARGFHLRQQLQSTLAALSSHTEEVIELQGLARAMLLRSTVAELLDKLERHEDPVALLQAAIRGSMVRSRYQEKQRYFNENMEKVIKVQSFVRGRLQGEAYKSLTTGKNPPVGTVKGFVHLLNDSDFDFDEEIGRLIEFNFTVANANVMKNSNGFERPLCNMCDRMNSQNNTSTSSTSRLRFWSRIRLRLTKLSNTKGTMEVTLEAC